MATQIPTTSSNLINQSIQNNIQTKPQTPVEGKSTTISKELNNKDTFTTSKKQKNKNETLYNILNFVGTGAFVIGIWFLPSIISLLLNKSAFKHSAFKKLEKIKPIIENNETTMQSTKVLKNKNVKTDIITETDEGVFHEILVITRKGDVIKRILIKKVKLLDKQIIANIRSYAGKGIENNAELEANTEKYLVKEYNRVTTGYTDHNITIKRAGKPEETVKLYEAKDRTPIFSIRETSGKKIHTKYLYDRNKLIGIDRIITVKDGSSEKNIYTIPKMNIFNKKYDPKAPIPYSKTYLDKLNKDF